MVPSILISAKINGRFKIPNTEVMADWIRWAVGSVESYNNIPRTCVEGPIKDFEAKWPNFMRQLNSKMVAKTRGDVNRKTPEKIYHVIFLGLMQSLRAEGWKVIVNARTGDGYVDLCLLHKRKHTAVMIEVKSSKKQKDLERDAHAALKQLIGKNYRNPDGLPNIRTLREYGVAGFHLSSHVKGRCIKLVQDQWVEQDEIRDRDGGSKKRKADGIGADGGRAS